MLLLAALWARSRSRRRRHSTGLAPPLAIGVAVLMLGYVLEVLGTLWPDAAFLQPYSPFHYLRPLEVLSGEGDPGDLLVLVAVFAVATLYGLWRFPRRDLAAPS